MHYFIDHYAVLNLNFDATEEEIKKAFWKLAKIYHPDKNGNPYTFHQIYISYKFLLDPEKRKKYNEVYKKYLEKSKYIENIKNIPPHRFKSSTTLKMILEKGIRLSKLNKLDKFFLLKINYDYILNLHPDETSKILIFNLPILIKKLCRDCMGSSLDCSFCNGIGWYTTQSIIKISVPPNILHNLQIMDIDLRKMKFKITNGYPKQNKIKILIQISSKS